MNYPIKKKLLLKTIQSLKWDSYNLEKLFGKVDTRKTFEGR